MTASLLLAGYGVMNGHNTIGDIVLAQHHVAACSATPLNFLGIAYREIKQGVTDIETMFALLDKEAEVKDTPGATPLVISEGRVTFDNVVFTYEPDRPILRAFVRRAGRARPSPSSGPRAPASRPSRACSSASTTSPPAGC